MPGFEWVVVRVVPRVERGEFVNVGAVVYSRELDFLEAQIEVDEPRLRALDPSIDVELVGNHLAAFADLCAGRGRVPESVSRSRGERFRWLTSPRSSVVQTSPIHTGVTTDPAAELERLMEVMVRAPQASQATDDPIGGVVGKHLPPPLSAEELRARARAQDDERDARR